MVTWLNEPKDLASPLSKNWGSLVAACERGVERCHDLNVDQDRSVLGKMLTSGGVCGTDDYEQQLPTDP